MHALRASGLLVPLYALQGGHPLSPGGPSFRCPASGPNGRPDRNPRKDWCMLRDHSKEQCYCSQSGTWLHTAVLLGTPLLRLSTGVPCLPELTQRGVVREALLQHRYFLVREAHEEHGWCRERIQSRWESCWPGLRYCLTRHCLQCGGAMAPRARTHRLRDPWGCASRIARPRVAMAGWRRHWRRTQRRGTARRKRRVASGRHDTRMQLCRHRV